nr:hypothetical protein Iba_chr12dCG19500 [Ipomoea batatas]
MLPMLTREPITKKVESVKANWEDLITDKGAEIIRLEGMKAINEGDSSIFEVMSFIKENSGNNSSAEDCSQKVEKEKCQKIEKEECQKVENEQSVLPQPQQKQLSVMEQHRVNSSTRIVKVFENLSNVIDIFTKARDAISGYK